jgi:hypothetical protein
MRGSATIFLAIKGIIMIGRILLSVVLVACAPMLAAQETDEAIHNELRALLSGIEQAVNTQSYGDLAQYVHESAYITTINQEVLSSGAEIEPYFESWFGEDGYLKSMKMDLEADALTEFFGDRTFGIVRGWGEEDYELANGRFFPMKTRWTATVSKNDAGEWKILALHTGTNFLDNPVLSATTSAAKYGTSGLGVVGLVVGLLLGYLFGRRKRPA